MQIAYVEKPVLADAEIYEGRLYAGLNVYHFSLIDISNVAAETRSLDVQLFKGSVINYRYSALLALSYIYEHLS